VVVVDLLERLGAEDAAHLGADDVAARIGVAAGELHRLGVAGAELGVRAQQHRRRVHLPLRSTALEREALSESEEAGRGFVAEPARAEVDADPDTVLLVGEQVDVVVAGADRPELLGGQVAQLPLRRERRVADLVDDRVVAGAPVVAADAEADAREVAGDARRMR